MSTKAKSLTKIDTSLSRDQVILALKAIAEGWQEATEEDGLLATNTSVGLILYDVTKALGLSYQEQEQILSSDLAEILAAIEEPISITA